MHEHLGVRSGREDVPARSQTVAQLDEVVDLAVHHDRDLAVLGEDRLVAARDVDDRQPLASQGGLARYVDAARIRASVDDPLAHRGHEALLWRLAAVDDAGDPAHAQLLAAVSMTRRHASPTAAMSCSRRT